MSKDDRKISESDWNMTRWRIEDLARLLRAATRFQFELNSGDKSVMRDYFSALKGIFFNISTLVDDEKREEIREDLGDLDESISKLEDSPEVDNHEISEIQEELEDFDMEVRQLMKEANLDFKKKKRLDPERAAVDGLVSR